VALALAAPVWAFAAQHGGAGAKEQEQNGKQAEIGAPAPDFSLTATDGKTYKLSDFKGKIVVLEWTNHECPFVNRCHHAKTMEKTFAEFKGKPVAWLAIDSSNFANDKKSEIMSWAEKVGVSYPILLDADGEVGHAYGAKTTPHMFVIDAKGNLAYSGAIDDNPYGDKKEDVRNYVEEAVSALLDGSKVAQAMTKPYGCSVKYKPS